MLERLSVEKLHGDEGLAFVFADFVDGANVGVIDRRGCLRLAPESFEGLRIISNPRRQKLESDEPVQRCVFGLVHNTHAATTEFLDDAVMRDGLAENR